MKKFLYIAFGLLLPVMASAQTQETIGDTTAMRQVNIGTVDVIPTAVKVKGMLLLNKDVQYELEGAVDNMYNFKYERAEKQFKSLRRRYPEHPLPYFLMGLSQWWKIVPTNIQTKKYDDLFFAYMDTTIQKAEELYDKNENNTEAAFFLAAANGFSARLHSERSNWRKATVHSKRAIEYMEIAKAGNGLSPEFLFGEALFNYYAIWIHENYKMLRPVLAFFPDGDKRLGLKQLRHVSNSGFYTGTEAKFFLMKIYANEEGNLDESMKIAQSLATKYPDNAYFQRFYARLLFVQGHFSMAERVSLDILHKLEQKMPGYEAVSGRYASYILAYVNQNKYRDLEKAKQYYQESIMYAEMSNERDSGYFINSYLNLARISDQQKDKSKAKRYYTIVINSSEKKSAAFKEARNFLKANKKVK
ncbi:tetratricopeptide repeat protein [Pontibacter sp. BT310]|uniref:Tetratricopeptide repeat protein n=1 Tax=Pontibacter populi TaxID=890055 RepID=A0ABS6XDW8_9BACT|nr:MULTISPECIES: tetratricopeptide repeat protein [Pontibacter]MBJ6119334.1 tetratricopeptide repeat protein [Pontibacter sp. BT310]MBR0571762.1 tetratricopeptide repeat protein [Microvirga sp. STS03]MBW3366188.1 tetratricopeptide repeat protein [Pontibacter populi]